MNLHTCLLTNNDCYKANRTITPKGVMVHSTGANNPNLRRYVQPNDGLLGENRNRNDWNRSGTGACVHAFIGQLADGSVATYQTLPWNHRGWHCGTGTSGVSANNTHISFEICEDNLKDESYFKAVYQEAAELTAYLCKMYDLDPLEDGVVICHQEGYRRGVASNHGDVLHWFPKFGKNMSDFRNDVAQIMREEEEVTQEQFDAMMDNWLSRKAKEPADDWADPYIQAAIKAKTFTPVDDGKGGKTISAPKSFPTRQELAVVVAALTK